MTLPERFWDKVKKTDTCWLWTGATSRGYGQIRWRGRVRYAHRVSYQELVGAIPSGFQVDHLCRIPACVNPDHLEAVTPQANSLRSESPTAKNAQKTHCPRGHALVPGNLVTRKTPVRDCRTCAVERTRRGRREKGWAT